MKCNKLYKIIDFGLNAPCGMQFIHALCATRETEVMMQQYLKHQIISCLFLCAPHHNSWFLTLGIPEQTMQHYVIQYNKPEKILLLWPL